MPNAGNPGSGTIKKTVSKRMGINYLSFLLFFPVMLFAPLKALPQEADLPVFSSEFWFAREEQPVFGLEEQKNESRESGTERKIRELLDEAVFTYSGMIYGFTFSYTPGDKKRGVEDSFIMEPSAIIPAGDPSLTARKTRNDSTRTYIRIEYRCDERHRNWISYWMSSTFPLLPGSGEGSVLQGFEGKKEAVNNAVKETVRNYLRGRVYNKPRSVTGSFVLAEPPVITYLAGMYTAAVKVRLDIKDIEDYTFF